jgi:hypothetical protein
MNKFYAAAAMVAFTASTAAIAAVTFDSTTGVGFVGKGDVQLALGGWNNATLQANAAGVTFDRETVTVTEVSWTCTNSRNEKVQERERTTTTETTGVVSHLARVNKQISGFNLTGFSGTNTVSETDDGPKLNSCPAPVSQWALTEEAGDPVEVSSSSTLYVNHGAQRAPLN